MAVILLCSVICGAHTSYASHRVLQPRSSFFWLCVVSWNNHLHCSLQKRTTVFALYNRSRRVAVLLLILILAEVGGSVRMLWLWDAIEIHGTWLLTQLNDSSRDRGWVLALLFAPYLVIMRLISILGFAVHCTHCSQSRLR